MNGEDGGGKINAGVGAKAGANAERLELMREYHLALRAWVAGEISHEELTEVSERWFDYLSALREKQGSLLPLPSYPPSWTNPPKNYAIRLVPKGGGTSIAI